MKEKEKKLNNNQNNNKNKNNRKIAQCISKENVKAPFKLNSKILDIWK